MARPIAASAPATVRIKIEKICPTKSCMKEEKATKLILTDNSINSIDIKSEMIFLRLTKMPLKPMVKSNSETIKK